MKRTHQPSEDRALVYLKTFSLILFCGALIFSVEFSRYLNAMAAFLTVLKALPIIGISLGIMTLLFIWTKRTSIYILPFTLSVFITSINITTNSIPLALYAWNFKCGHLQDQYISVMEVAKFLKDFDPEKQSRLWYISDELAKHPVSHCAKTNLAGIYGCPVISTGSLFGAIWGTQYKVYEENIAINQYKHYPELDFLLKNLPPQYQHLLSSSSGGTKNFSFADSDTPEVNDEFLSKLASLDAGVLGGYMYSKSFSELPDAHFWRSVLPDHYKLNVLAHKPEDHEIALKTLKEQGFTMKNKKVQHVQNGVISFYMTFGEMVRTQDVSEI